MKLLCKKKHECVGLTPLIKGKYYTIDNPYQKLSVLTHLGVPQIWFNTTNKNSQWYIWNYFYTPQEERKIKLQKLNEITL